MNHLFVTLGLAFVFGLSLRLGLGFLFLCHRTLYDLQFPYFLPEVMVKFMRWAREHLVTLIEIGMHLIECISGLNSGIGGKCK